MLLKAGGLTNGPVILHLEAVEPDGSPYVLGKKDEVQKLGLSGGTENDIKVYLTWDTDHSDVDLWVTTPGGEKVFYSHRNGKNGEALYDDVTTGYGPESFTASKAAKGEYLVQVNYFGRGRSNFSEARRARASTSAANRSRGPASSRHDATDEMTAAPRITHSRLMVSATRA